MAKGKRSAALFEVIHSGKPSRMYAPIRRRKSSVIAQMLRSTGTPFAAAGNLLRGSANALVVRNRPARPPKTPITGVDLTMDSDRQLINFRVSYHSAIVAGFALLVAIGLAYAVGMKMNHRLTAATTSPSTAELRAHGAHPEVLNVSNGEMLTQNTASSTPTLPSMAAVDPHMVPQPDDTQAVKAADTTPATPDRVIGRDYVIVQTFADENSARSAQTLLSKNKIPTTIENGLAGWAPKTKFCVVTTGGFDHLRNNPDFEKLESTITQVGQTFASQNKARPFEPHAYRWKGPA